MGVAKSERRSRLTLAVLELVVARHRCKRRRPTELDIEPMVSGRDIRIDDEAPFVLEGLDLPLIVVSVGPSQES